MTDALEQQLKSIDQSAFLFILERSLGVKKKNNPTTRRNADQVKTSPQQDNKKPQEKKTLYKTVRNNLQS